MPKGGKEGARERERERAIETPETTRALEGDASASLARSSGVSATCATQKTVESPRVQFIPIVIIYFPPRAASGPSLSSVTPLH